MNGDTIMRACRIGTSSGTRVVACSSISATGSARPAGGVQPSCKDRGVRRRASLPYSRRASKSVGGGGASSSLVLPTRLHRLGAHVLTSAPSSVSGTSSSGRPAISVGMPREKNSDSSAITMSATSETRSDSICEVA